jgi:hypothetical protein
MVPCFQVNLSLYISSPVEATGAVTIPGFGITNAFSVTAWAVTRVDIDPSLVMSYDSDYGAYGIYVTASQPVSVVAVNYDLMVTTAFTCLPVTALGTNYWVLARPALVGGSGCRSQFMIVATADNTMVSITPSATANLPGHSGYYQTNLMQGETYQAGPSDADYTNDVTGTWISSDKPIVVLAGASLAYVPDSDSPYGNPLVQEQRPVDAWGDHVLALSFAAKTGGDSYRVLAASNNTALSTNGVSAGTIQAGQFLDFILDGPVEFSASGPIQVAQFANGGSDEEELGDPCEVLLAPVGRYLQTNIVFSLPLWDQTTTGDFRQNYLNIIVPESALANTLVDGSSIAVTNFVPIGASGYYGARIPLPEIDVGVATHTVTSSEPVGVQVYGFGDDDAYAYLGGF